ncbi:MAG: ImmA/IrrE family metallo-endopeptidase [Nitrospirota bacterium]
MATFDRGFKIWAERTSVGVRRELGVQAHGPLFAPDLARFLKVELITPHDVQGLEPSHKRQLLNADPDGWSAVTVESAGRHIVVYNPKHSFGRQSSDQMHELAHILIGHEASRLVISQDGAWVMRSYDQKQEDEAAWFSGCLLLPREALLYIARHQIPDDAACEQYRVSLPMLVSRRNLSGVALQLRRRISLRRGPR